MFTLPELLAGLPPEPGEAGLFPAIRQAVIESKRKLVVIDDDPTGTQTVHDVELLITWNAHVLAEMLKQDAQRFYVLTNSRSMPESKAVQVNRELAQQLVEASLATEVDVVVASRSVSTLRGHYPAEIFALASGLTALTGKRFDGHLVVPAFFEGGRYTIGDTHYVAMPTASLHPQDGRESHPYHDTSSHNRIPVVPASETPFAQDRVFGYTTAYLPAWIEAKSGGYWKAQQVISIGLERIRQGGPEEVAALLQTVEGGRPVIINAAGYGDLAVVVLGLLRAEAAGKRFLYRTAASFVRLRGAVETRPLLQAPEIIHGGAERAASGGRCRQPPALVSSGGGLVIVGSYVPGSSVQLEHLLRLPNVTGIELPVERVLRSAAESRAVSHAVGQQLEAAIKAGRVGAVYTSRTLVTGENRAENLAIGENVSHALIAALTEVMSRPRFIIVKGGITSHDVAQKGLGAVRALVLGQLFPGVPVWKLETEAQSKFAGVPYVVFPGNVGDPESLAQAVKKLYYVGENNRTGT